MPSRRSFLKALGAALVGAAVAPTVTQWVPVEYSIPITWSNGGQSLADIQKIEAIRRLMDNAIQPHDDAIEEALFKVTPRLYGWDGRLVSVQDDLPRVWE